MGDQFITKNNSLSIKGIAIIMMIIHHLFAFPDRTYSGGYVSIYSINNIPVEYYLGEIGKICVSMFLFLGGYGTYKIYKEDINYQQVISRVIKLYINYWIVFITFVPLGVILGKINVNFKSLFLNFIAVSSSINNEWWFFIDYIVLVIFYPLLVKLICRYNKCKIILCSFLTFCIGSIANVILYRINITMFEFIFNIMNLQFMFISGIIICKYKIYDYINKYVKKRWQYTIMIIVSILILFMFPIKTLIYSIITPILIFSLIKIIKESKILIFLGKHSNNIWLTHTFFCYYYFKELTFMPRYSILIVIWTIVLSLISSIFLNKFKDILNKIFKSIKSYSRNIYNLKS